MRAITVVLASVSLLCLSGLGCDEIRKMQDKAIEKEMNHLGAQVAEDQVRAYNLAKKGGDAVELCVQAGLVAECYKQAEDESNYLKWKDVERQDCRRAGVPK